MNLLMIRLLMLMSWLIIRSLLRMLWLQRSLLSIIERQRGLGSRITRFLLLIVLLIVGLMLGWLRIFMRGMILVLRGLRLICLSRICRLVDKNLQI